MGTPLTNTGEHVPHAGPGSAEWRWLSLGSCSLPSVSVLLILSVVLVLFYELLAPPKRSGHQGREAAESVAMHSEAGPCNGLPRGAAIRSLLYSRAALPLLYHCLPELAMPEGLWYQGGHPA